jgi:hypothetical protein
MNWTLPFDPDSDILKQQEARDERQNDAAAGATEVTRIMFFAEFFHGGQTPAAWLWRIQNSVAHVSFMPESVRRLQSLHSRSLVRNGEGSGIYGRYLKNRAQGSGYLAGTDFYVRY